MANRSENNTLAHDDAEFDIDKFDVSCDTGFMLSDPLKWLPSYFELWNKLASSVPELVRDRKLREAVHKLPLLDYTKLAGHQELRLAHLQLSLVTACYIWQEGDKGVMQVLPKSVAIPYFNISKLLGVQPILSHIDLVLANWARKDPFGPYTLENLEVLYHLPGGWPADWFCIVTFMVEFSFAKCVKPIVRILNLLESSRTCQKTPDDEGEAEIMACLEVGQEAEIVACLEEVRAGVKAMEDSLARMRDHLEGRVFFNVIRPFLGGWGGEGSPLPDGLVYEGVSDVPVKLTGGSAAQSTTLQVLDAVLSVHHTQDKREFLVKMRDFMPPGHRHFIEHLENLPYKLRDYVTSSTDQTLKSSYNKALSAVVDLRDYHIKIVKMYILLPSKQANEGNYESLDKKGTGGTSLVPFLKDIWSDTKEKLVTVVEQPSGPDNGRWNLPVLVVNIFIAAAAITAAGFAAKSMIRK